MWYWYIKIFVWIFDSTYRKGEILMQKWHVNSQFVLLLHEIHIGVGVVSSSSAQWQTAHAVAGHSGQFCDMAPLSGTPRAAEPILPHARSPVTPGTFATRFRWLEVAALLVLLGQRGWGCYGDLVGQFSLPLSIRLCLCIFIICELILLVYCCKLFLYNTLSQFTCVNMGLLFILLIHALLCSFFQFCFVY